MATKHSQFFTNRECEYFPCHKNADPEDFNCLFCYCPLYVLGNQCGGNFVYHANGRKVCTNCTFPHRRENYAAVIARYKEILSVMERAMSDSAAVQDALGECQNSC